MAGKTSGSGDTLERVVFGDQLFHPGLVQTGTDRRLLRLSRTTFARVNVFRHQEQQGYAEETALPGVERKVPDADDRRRQTDGERDDRLDLERRGGRGLGMSFPWVIRRTLGRSGRSQHA